jgi:hypothetical protein
VNGNSMVCLGVLMGKDSKPSAESNYCKVSVMIRHQLDRILRCLESKEVWSSYKALVTLLTCWKPKFVPIYSNIHANIHSNIHSVIFQYSFRYIPIFFPLFHYISSNFHSNIAGNCWTPDIAPHPRRASAMWWAYAVPSVFNQICHPGRPEDPQSLVLS